LRVIGLVVWAAAGSAAIAVTKSLRRIIVYRTQGYGRRAQFPFAIADTLFARLMESDQILSFLSRDPWKNAPTEQDPVYFRTWQRTSIALQRGLRRWIPNLYFRDTARFEDRDTAYQLILYAACRPCYGQPRIEFTFDMADPSALTAALRSIGHATQLVLAPMEQRLRAEGRPQLALRYMPVWYQDIILAVKKKPKSLIRLLANEAKLIDAIIDLGTSRDAAAAARFLRTAHAVLRTVLGDDMRELIAMLLAEAGRTLAEQNRPPGSVGHLLDTGVLDNHDVPSTGSPDSRVRSEENRDDRHPDGCGEVSNAGIVSDVNLRGGKPAGELIQVGNADGSVDSWIKYFLGAGAPPDGQVES
jgi:hypothetical protein